MSNSELIEARRFLKRLVFFCIPILLYMGFIAVCDPFDFLGRSSAISDAVKLRSASPLNPCLWKMARYQHDLAPNILLGDSRMLGVSPEELTTITGERYANLAYGGASMRECIQTFWFAAHQVRLRKVYFGVSFDMYNDYNLVDRTDAYLNIAANPTLYFINRTVLQAAAYSVYSAALNKDLKIGVPDMDRQAFWDYEVRGPQTTRMFRTYLYPTRYYQQLVEIGKYARQNGIELAFVVFPTHTDFQERFQAFGMEPLKERMDRDLAAISRVYDFDYPNDLTRDAAKFRDPIHLTEPAVRQVINEVWGSHVKYAHVL